MLKEFFIILCCFAWKFNKISAQSQFLAESLSNLLSTSYIPKESNLRFVYSVKSENLNQFNDFLSTVLTKNIHQSVILEISSLKPVRDGRRLNIFIVDSLQSFDKIYLKLNFYKFRITKLVTVVSLKFINESEIQEIFNYFADRLMVNVNVLRPNQNIVDLFTYFPFSKENPCGSTKPVIINSFDQKWQNNHFKIHKSTNMYGCVLKIGVAALSTEPGVIVSKSLDGNNHLSGIEKEIFDEFSKRLNFKANYKIFQFQVGSVFENGTGSGVLGKLINDEVDVAIGLISLQLVRAKLLSVSWFYNMNALSIIVPPGEDYGEIEKLLLPFSRAVWICVNFVFLITVFITLISLKYPTIYNFIIGRHIKSPILNIIAQHLGVTQPTLPERNFARFVLMSLLLYCLVVRSSYQGAVFKTLMSNDKKPPVKSISEIMERGFTFYIYETLASRFENYPNYRNRKIFPIKEIDIYRRKTLDSTFKGVVFNYETQILFLNQMNFKNFSYTICRENFLTSSFVFYFRKNHFIVDDINDYIKMMHANGFIDFISRKYADKKYIKREEDTGPKVLELIHLYGAFKIYIISNLIAFVVFIFEILMKKLRN